MNNRIRNSENRIRNFDEEKWTARDTAYRPGGLPDWSAAGFGKPPKHSEQWWRHEVSNAWAEGYEKGRVFCGCGDQIMPDDGAECGACVAARNAEKQWAGLTTAERKALWNTTKKPSEFAELIEAKLRAKNGFA